MFGYTFLKGITMNQSAKTYNEKPISPSHWLPTLGFSIFRIFTVILGICCIGIYGVMNLITTPLPAYSYLFNNKCKNIFLTSFKWWDSIMKKSSYKRTIRSRTDDDDYLIRYYILMKDRSQNFPFNIFIHKFLKSDPDDLHDHPWGFFTLILWGGYWEYTRKGKFWRAPGYFNMVDASWTHRVELEKNRPCWTLFIPFQHIRKWGFYKNGEWMESDEYFAMRRKALASSHDDDQ